MIEEIKFSEAMMNLLKITTDRVTQFRSGIVRIDEVPKSTYKEFMLENNFQRLEDNLAITLKLSKEIEELERIMASVGRVGLDSSRKIKSDFGKVKKVVEMIDKTSKYSLAGAERLPFSLGKGWVPEGDISLARRLINVVGYVLVLPGIKTSEKVVADYNLSLREIDQTKKKYDNFKKENPGKYDPKMEKEIKNAIKKLKIFVRIARDVERHWYRTSKECDRLLKQTYTKIPRYVTVDGAFRKGKTFDLSNPENSFQEMLKLY
jgi:hypothetical protein